MQPSAEPHLSLIPTCQHDAWTMDFTPSLLMGPRRKWAGFRGPVSLRALSPAHPSAGFRRPHACSHLHPLDLRLPHPAPSPRCSGDWRSFTGTLSYLPLCAQHPLRISPYTNATDQYIATLVLIRRWGPVPHRPASDGSPDATLLRAKAGGRAERPALPLEIPVATY